MGLGFMCLSPPPSPPEALLSRFGAGPPTLRVSLSTELFPLGYDNWMEIPLLSTSSPGTGVPKC